MIPLNGVTERIVSVVSGAIVTSPVSIVTGWRVMGPVKHLADGAGFNISDSTPVVIVPTPAVGEQHAVEEILVYNNDTVAHTVTLLRVTGAGSPVSVPFKSIPLGAGESMEYNGKGFDVYANNGAVKQVYQNGTSPIGTNVQMVTLSSPVVNNNAVANTIQDVTGLSFAVNAGSRYRFKFVIYYTAASTSTGSRWSVNGPGSPTELNYDSDYSLTASTRTINTGQSSYDLPAASNATSASTVANIAIVEGVIVPSANGVVIARFASEVLSSAITARPGSYVEFQQLT